MVESEREMVRKLDDSELAERFTSLQPTYEDTIPPDPEDWELDQDYREIPSFWLRQNDGYLFGRV